MSKENLYGPTRVGPGNTTTMRDEQVRGEPSAPSDKYAKMSIGDRLQEENPHIVEREMKEVHVSPAPCSLNGTDVKGYVTVQKAGLHRLGCDDKGER